MRIKDSVIVQLRDLEAWSKQGSRTTLVSLLDYVGFIATLDMVFAFAELFLPELVVHEGRRFLASGFTKATYDGWVQKGTSPKEIQRVMNHIHMSTLIQNQEVSDEAACEAARAIALIWSRTLGPEGLQAEAIGEDFTEAAVTFFERTEA